MVIGDLFQLSPVIRNDSVATLSNYYESPFFFDSWAWKKCNPITIELSKIYRQDDKEFISILNNIRIGKKHEQDLETLNQRVSQNGNNENVITLTTHNSKANKINSVAAGSQPYHLSPAGALVLLWPEDCSLNRYFQSIIRPKM